MTDMNGSSMKIKSEIRSEGIAPDELGFVARPKSFLSLRNGTLLFVLIVFVSAIKIFPCGPFFPNTLLDLGDAAIMSVPEARFQKELARMKLVATPHRAVLSTNYPRQTLDAELSDLDAALSRIGISLEARRAIVESHRTERKKISVFGDNALGREGIFVNGSDGEFGFVLRPEATNSNRIQGALPKITPGLPAEFADYLRGSIAWHQGDLPAARKAWISLLSRAPKERHFKSTWAAFMLGKSWEEDDRTKACKYFQMVRQFAEKGFADSLGLAASSLGWEGRCYFRDGNLAKAIDLYLEQAASGDLSAVDSLRRSAARALVRPVSQLSALASQPRAQRVITAYVISGGFRQPAIDVDNKVRESALHALERASASASWMPTPKPTWHRFEEPVLRWLNALEHAKVADVEAAEQIALAAYQAGQMEMAQRWLNRARVTPISQWLQAKLFLRDGKIDRAAALLAKVSRLFPVGPNETNQLAPAGLAANLYVKNSEYDVISVAQEIRGELGVFHLARRQFAEALQALLESGFWADAAYVAERVLTLDELKKFVDRSWPSANPRPANSSNDVKASDQHAEGSELTGEQHELSVRENIRYLLARRLARAKRLEEAREYFPSQWLPVFDRLCAALRDSSKAILEPALRARACFDAAVITRENGLELIGTEVEPDWQIHGGNYQDGVTVADRAGLQSTNYLTATLDELSRASAQSPSPDVRFHYRYTAAALAWEAAKLMPNNSDETARVLWLAGTWLKNRDPIAADVFYKALVRRCRRTALGAEADKLRWFPKSDKPGAQKEN